MKRPLRKSRRPRYDSFGTELAGALSIASQMALLCPPGFDELIRHELSGGNGHLRPTPDRTASSRLR